MEERGSWGGGGDADVPLKVKHLSYSTLSSQLHTALCLTHVRFVMSDDICNL